MSALGGQTRRSADYHDGPTRHAPHFIYRCYDKDDDLIYIGCTSNVKRRISAHRRGGKAVGRWLTVSMVRHEVEGPFDGRDAGRAAERSAIQVEQPLFNYQERAGVNLAAWMTRAPVARYLIERGHLDLAADTVCACERETLEAGGFDEWCLPHVELARQEAAA